MRGRNPVTKERYGMHVKGVSHDDWTIASQGPQTIQRHEKNSLKWLSSKASKLWVEIAEELKPKEECQKLTSELKHSLSCHFCLPSSPFRSNFHFSQTLLTSSHLRHHQHQYQGVHTCPNFRSPWSHTWGPTRYAWYQCVQVRICGAEWIFWEKISKWTWDNERLRCKIKMLQDKQDNGGKEMYEIVEKGVESRE